MANNEVVGDPYVFYTQQWLNDTYGNDSRFNTVTENGKTGWATIYALTRALQIELGIQATADNFGTGTQNAFNTQYPNGVQQQSSNDETKRNIYGIIQGALLCKGYAIGANRPTCNFYGGTGGAIKNLKEDAGLTDTSSTVTLNIMKALLSMDYFYSYDTSTKTKNIQKIQRYLNANYEAYIGLTPCDGIYGRGTNKALIYAIQAEEGMSTSVANGNFGPSTKRCCPTIPYNNAETNYNGSTYSNTKIGRFAKLVNMGLYVNGVGDGDFGTTVSTASVKQFQNKYALPVTGIVNLTTWLSIFISSGDTSRSAKACDCATILTAAKAQTLYNNGYRYVGRYLSGTIVGGASKALTVNEMNIAFNAGLRIFPIQQASANTVSYFTETQAVTDTESAYNHASDLGIPTGTIIYFAVDCDPQDSEITNYIIPYFAKVFSTMVNTYKNKYKIGIYGTRNVCSRVSEKGYAISSFVGDMSTGFSGNLGFTIPDNWAFDQFATVTIGSGNGQIEIDKDGFSGRDSGIGSTGLSDIERVYNNLKDLYRYVLSYKGAGVKEANMLLLEYLRHLAPDNKYGSDVATTDMWAIIAGPRDYELCMTIDAITSFKEDDFRFKDPNNNQVIYDTLHFAATLNALLYNVVDPEFIDFDSFIDDYAGWAGDAITFALDVKELSLNQTQANELICTTNDSHFSLADYYADVDAVVFAKMLKEDEIPLPEMFFKYFMSVDLSTGQSYLSKRTTEFLRLMGTYNTFLETCNTVMNSDVFPYPKLRGMLVSPESDYKEEFKIATIAFLKFVGEESIRESN